MKIFIKSNEENIMKNSITTIVLSLFLIYFTLEAKAQQNFTVTIKMPPPGTLNVSDFWNVTVNNNSGSDQSGYLTGTAKEDKDGMIAKGTTVPVMFKKGVNNIKIKDLPKTPDVEYLASDPRYKESLIRQGKFPSGKYEICVKVISAGTNEELGSDCINQEVLETGLLTLISPDNGQAIDAKSPVTFTWTSGGKVPEGGYILKIVEVTKGQTPEAVIKSNRVFFEKKGIKSTTFQYPNSASLFGEGKKYAWMVSSGNTVSEVWSFSMMSSSCSDIGIDSLFITCDDDSNKVYDYRIKLTNHCTNNNVNLQGVFVTSFAYGAGSVTLPPILPTVSGLSITTNSNFVISLAPGASVWVTGTINALSMSGNNFEFFVWSQSPTFGKAYDFKDTTLINCSQGCCDGFTKEISQSLNSSGGLSVTMKAGPNRISKVTMDLVYIKSTTDPNCPICKQAEWGALFCLWCQLGGFGEPTDGNYRELTWTHNTGVDMYSTARTLQVGLVLDPVFWGGVANVLMSCCKTDVEYCIRYSFTDTNCVTCDTVICSKESIGGISPRIVDDSIRQKYDGIEGQLKNKIDLRENEQIEKGIQEEMENKDYDKKEGEGQSNKIDNSIPIQPPVPFCTDFNDQQLHGWSGYNVHTTTALRAPGDYFLHGRDLCNCTFMYNDQYSGDWTTLFTQTQCANLCFDVRLFDDYKYGVHLNVSPVITICNGWNASTSPTSANNCNWNIGTDPVLAATFITSTPITEDLGANPGWHTVCAPIAFADAQGNLPSNAFGYWKMNGSGTAADWNSLIANVSYVKISFDYTSGCGSMSSTGGEKIGYDNICIQRGPCPEPADKCCKNFKKKVTSSITTNNKLKVSFSADPSIKRIVAEIIKFSTSYNDPNCATCSNNSDVWGNFNVPDPNLISVFGLPGKLTVPNNSTSKFGREIVWGSLFGSGINMTSPSPPIEINLGLPVMSRSSCCADTIKMCVKYKFSDINCITCDTVVCYKIVRAPDGRIRGGVMIEPEENITQNQSDQSNSEQNIGQSAGILKIDNEISFNVKVTIYDVEGKELLKLLDHYLKKGQYTFDLHNYNLPDGEYFYKSECGNKTEYKKILLTKLASSCNCGQ